jgi:RNA polymerase sigma-54 factor
MDMKQEMSLKQRQQMVMTPKLQQAIKLLAMPALELQMVLKQQLLTNPLLEEADEVSDEAEERATEQTPDTAADPASEDEGELKTSEEQIDWNRYLNDGFEMGQRSSGEHEETEEYQDRVPVARLTLAEHLMSQLRLATGSDQEREIGEFVIGSLDGDGFLDCSVEEIAALKSWDPVRVTAVVEMIKTFDPPGIAARDLRECLLIQLAQRGLLDSVAGALVAEHLDDLLQRRYPEIARKMKKTVREIQSAAEVVATLDPRPGARFAQEEPRYIVPDLLVDKVEDRYVVQLNDRDFPRLRINPAYRRILADARSESKSQREFVIGKLNQAKWLIKTIDKRRRTMITVMEAILDAQKEFFDKGIEYLKPLTLQQIAVVVGVVESTVSRVTSNKYVQTPRGVFELKYFFSTGLRTEHGEAASSKKIKERIKNLIEAENKTRPLSDQEIGRILKDDGFYVARRTVAKYREQMGILQARQRKQY